MSPPNLGSWKESVVSLNNDAKTLVSQRDACYGWIANEIKDKFAEEGLPIPNVHINSLGDKITCKFGGDETLKIPPLLISKIGMKFNICSRYDEDGVFKKMLIFYPFED